MTTQVKVIIIITLIAVLGGGAFLLTNNKSEPDTVTNQTPTESMTENSSEQTVSEPQFLTAEEVAKHNQKTDCWTIISGSVYDITEYVPRHPGGDEIILACGTDGTSLFFNRTTSSGEEIGSGNPHSSNASRQLKDYLIGTLQL